MIPVEGYKNLFRDEKTGAIVNMDSTGFSNYMSEKRRNSDKQAEMDAMKEELETLKLMLKELASKITS
jgi:peroxiredoxin family protein|tara:strand:+ start:807 stop:1010 length:204 start_codon:yes stop_codon:yes gene_type:complete